MNAAYKHLESKLKIGEFTIGQWAGVVLGVALMLAWGLYISPFGSSITIATSVYVGGIPIVAAVLVSYAEVNVLKLVLDCARWRRSPARYMPGSGEPTPGYVITPDLQAAQQSARSQIPALDLEKLWDS